MNRNSSPVKGVVNVHESERGRLAPVKIGRASDAALAWYCHWRISQLLESGVNQKDIAKKTRLPPSAINHLLKNGKGVGSLTAAALTELFGFKTRGALIDAADEWFVGDGKHYALHEQRRQSRERERKLLESAEESEKSVKSRKSSRKSA